MDTLFAPFVIRVLHGSGAEFGMISAVQAVGGIIGGLVAASAGQRYTGQRLWAFGAMAFGGVDLLLFGYPVFLDGIWPAVVLMIVVGVPAALTIAGLVTVVQASPPTRSGAASSAPWPRCRPGRCWAGWPSPACWATASA